MYKVITILIILLTSISFIYAEDASSIWQPLTKGYADTRYCVMYGTCILDSLSVVGNLSYFNVTNYNVTGNITADGLILQGFQEGSIPFFDANSLLIEDNINLFWDDANNRLGIGTSSPSKELEVNGEIYAKDDISASTDGSSAANPRVFGYTDLSSGEACRFQFGDSHNGFQNGYGQDTTIYAYWGIVLSGGMQNYNAGFLPPDFTKTTDAGVTIRSTNDIGDDPGAGNTGIITLVVEGVSGQTKDLIHLRDSNNNNLTKFTSQGNVFINNSLNVTKLCLDNNGECIYSWSEVNMTSVNVTGGGGGVDLDYTNYLGSDFSGSDGDKERTLQANVEMVVIDMQYLHPDIDYTYNGTHLILNESVYDEQVITLWSDSGFSYTNYLGSDLTGADGSKNRELTHNNSEMIIVDMQLLQPVYDYTSTGTTVTFLEPVYNEQTITIWS